MNFTLPFHRLVVVLSIILWAASLAPAQTAAKRMTIVSAARLRSAPNTSASVIDTLPIGVLLDEVGGSDLPQPVKGGKDYWYKVRTADNKQGWVLGSLTRVVDPKQLDKAYVELVHRRLRIDNLDFSNWVDLAAFCKRTAAAVRKGETRGELEFAYLRATSNALLYVPDKWREDLVEPYGSYVDSLGETVFYDELAHGWYVDPDEYWRLRDRYIALPLGEEIAWVATDSLPGECEGYVDCYLYGMVKYGGRYLKLYPNGKYTDEVFRGYIELLKDYSAEKYPRELESDYVDREAIHKTLAEVREIVSKASGRKQAEALGEIDRVDKIFK